MEQVYNVIDSRYRSRRPLIVTTNLSLQDLQHPQDTAHARIEDVPWRWYCYDLRGTAQQPTVPHALVDHTEENCVGSVLSYLPLKKGGSQFRLVKDMFQMTGTNPSLAEFCAEEQIRCPETPICHQLCPAAGER